jgi:hypothetical protein
MTMSSISAVGLSQDVLSSGLSSQQGALQSLQNNLASGDLNGGPVGISKFADGSAKRGDGNWSRTVEQFSAVHRCGIAWQRTIVGRSVHGPFSATCKICPRRRRPTKPAPQRILYNCLKNCSAR